MSDNIILFLILFFFFQPIQSQGNNSKIGNGCFHNPIISADYSDPDIIKANDGYYMVSSSFNCMPGIPVLFSKDLVNWTIVNHVYPSLPFERYNKPQHGEGCWAPSIRFHNGLYYIYFCTPHEGLFVATAKHPREKWKLQQVVAVELWEDPCPFWDEDGSAWLVRSKVCGNELFLHRMSADGTKLLDDGRMIFKDDSQPIIEGPKIYHLNGYYYIFAPAGGVEKGWQTVLRSKRIDGPYECKVVMHQGSTAINGPHQGGLIQTDQGDWWFVHFQSKGYMGRVVHLQPVGWQNDWPVIGIDTDQDGIGEPLVEFTCPVVGDTNPNIQIQTSDEFDGESLGLQWQWHANPRDEWYHLHNGHLRLNAVNNPSQNGNLWLVPNLLMQKFPDEAFSATAKVYFNGNMTGEKCGLVIMGNEWAYLSLVKEESGINIGMYQGAYHQCNDLTSEKESIALNGNQCYLKVEVRSGGICQFSYSTDNISFKNIGSEFKAREGRWIGAKIGLFCINPGLHSSDSYADFDWFIIK